MVVHEGRPAFVLLIVLTAFAYVTMLAFNSLAGNPAKSGGLFVHGIGNVSAKYELQITPAGWTFGIWGIIYFFPIGWIVYAVYNIFRTINEEPAYLSPVILSPTFFQIFIVNNISNIAWLFIWDREYITQALPVLGLTAVTCYMGLLIGYTRLENVREELVDEGRQAEITFIRIFVFNGLGLYGAWTTIATTINFGAIIAYKMESPVSQDTTAVICLGIIAAVYVIFVILDLTILEKYARFTYSPYLLLLWALGGILSKNWNPEQTSSIIVAVLMGLGVVGLIIKLVVSFWFQKRSPVAYRKVKVWATLGNEVYPNLSVK